MNRKQMIDSQLQKQKGQIHFRGMGITNEEFEYICAKVECPDVNHITLNNFYMRMNFITHNGMLHISRISWDRLADLNLNGNKIGDQGCKYLAKTHIPYLRSAHLNANNIGDAGLMHLSKGQWRELNILNVSMRQEFGSDVKRVQGQSHLIRGNWRLLENLIMARPDLTLEQGKIVLLCEFRLRSIDIRTINEGKQSVRLWIKAKLPKTMIIV